MIAPAYLGALMLLELARLLLLVGLQNPSRAWMTLDTNMKLRKSRRRPRHLAESEFADDWHYVGSSVSSLKQVEAPQIDKLGVPLLIAPLGFRQNSLFYGFQFELDQLHQRLSSQKKRSIGSSAVVLWGPPGSGKTHLAREYVWRHRADFPGGIFWVDCKSEESMCK